MTIPDLKQKHCVVGCITLDQSSPAAVEFPSFSAHYEKDILRVNSSTTFTRVSNHEILLLGTIFDVLDRSLSLALYRDNMPQLISRLFAAHGPACATMLDGFFLLIIHDTVSKDIFIINNRYQATQLYYTIHAHILYFAHSLKLLLTILPFSPRLDLAAIPSFLQTGFSYTEKTQFQDIARLLPTQYLHIHEGKLTLSDHWQGEYRFDRKPILDTTSRLNEYETLFRTSIHNFIDATQPQELGCFVSGGHDTSYTFIQATKVFPRPIHSFTGSFENFGFDENPKAQYLINKFGGIHHPIVIGEHSLRYVPWMVYLSEEPLSGGAFPIFVCLLEASKYVDGMLSGDAGDTLWGEYYPVNEWHKYLCHVPLPFRKLLKNINSFFLRLTDWERLSESDHVFSLFAQRDIYHDFFSRLCTYRHYNNAFLRELLDPDLFKDIVTNKCMIDVPFNKHNLFDALVEAKMLYGLYQYMLPPNQKPLQALGVDHYSPYLNHTLINFINALPEKCLNDGTSLQKLTNDAHRRKLHKLAMLKYLPKRYVYSAQQSLDVPFHSFLKQRSALLTILLNRLRRRGFFNNKSLDRLFREFPLQQSKPHEIIELKHHGYRIFCLLTFEIWGMQFLDHDKHLHIPTQNTLSLEDYLSS
jgi:asparagine synthase (glutamine-hydrolysing)